MNSVMCKAAEVGKIVINRCVDAGLSIDTPKVQKLLVLMHGEYLAKFGIPLFPEPVEVWRSGVAIQKVHDAFRAYLEINEKQTCYILLLENEEAVIHSVIDAFGGKDVFEINEDQRLVTIKQAWYREGEKRVVPNDYIQRVFQKYRD